MDQRSVRVVVGQADRARGSLSDALTDDGFLVVGEAQTIGELARALQDAEPDVIVLDDSIGVAAAQLATELSPRAKLVVIWPAAVMPIAGAARVDPGEVAMALSATVGLVAGIELSGLASIDRPDWIDKVRKDPATLREKLAAGGAAPVRPSVTELQRRGQRLHPSPGAGRRRSARSGRAAAAAGALSIAATAPSAGAGPTGPAASETDAMVSRRIGMVALGGAAVAGALMIALSFGPNRSPSVVAAAPFLPYVPIGAPTTSGPPSTDPTPGGGGQNPDPTTPPPTDGGTTPISPPISSPPSSLPPAGGAGGPEGTGGGGTGGGGTGGGGTGGGGSGTRNLLAAVAGSSAESNPHNGAPGLKDSGAAAQNPLGGPPGLTDSAGGGHGPNGSHAGGHTPHGDHPAHPLHSHKR